MSRLVIFTITLWLLIFTLRLLQIGGLDPAFREQENEILRPLREYLSQKLDRLMPYPQSSLLSGIILGTGKNLPFSLKNKLKSTGTIHMVVVSGQNLTIMTGMLTSLVYLFGRKKTAFFSILAITFYCLLTGLGVPVIRAAIMAGASLIGEILGKERTGWWILFLSASLMLLYQPNWLISLSFLLSFTATFGVVVIAPILVEYLKVIPKLLRNDLAITISAYFMVLPFIAYNFGTISLVAILVNSLILWVIPIVMLSGFATIIVSVVSSSLGGLVALIPTVLLTYLIYLVELFSKFDFSIISIGTTSWWMWVGYYFVVGGTVLGLKLRNTNNYK